MKGDRLYDIVDYILNDAPESELEVIRAALKRRIEGGEVRGPMGLNPVRLARETLAKVRTQMGGSIEQIRSTVRNYAVEIIKKNAPELTEEQVRDLLDAWVPGEEASRPRKADAAPPEKPVHRTASKGKGLPPQVLATMIAQFVAYGTESMSISEQVKLREEIPDWHKKYWELFSPRQRQLISLYINGDLDKAAFWERIHAELGIEPNEPPA